MIVADTHAVLWWTLEPARLGRRAAGAFADADRIGVPTIVFWEVSVLLRRGKIEMQMPIAEWANRLLAIPRVAALPLDANVALRADTLAMHPDPADRFIVATAIELRSRLVTKDAAIRRSRTVETIW